MAIRHGSAGRFWLGQDGAATVEYAALITFLAMAIVVAITVMSGSMTGLFLKIATGMS
jgi:Flp pilus assembly pilin Flp